MARDQNLMHIFTTSQGTLEYRIVGNGNKTAIIFPGGHMDASVNLGEDFFIKRGYQVITLSRPGYGKTSLATGPSPDSFADTVAQLLESLNIHKIVAVGISAGGRSAVRLAAKYPRVVEKLILQCATSFMPWPDAQTRRVARIAFNPSMEKFTWQIMRRILKASPRAGLKMMLGNMSTLNPDDVIDSLSKGQTDGLINIFAHLQSGKGFMNDLAQTSGSAKDVHVPTLIIHSKYDKSVSLEHAKKLHSEIAGSRLFITTAESHMIWFSTQYDQIQKEMGAFLDF
ncbi:MAG TPA: alpha/beta hydrolase [Candidatus Saccharimonadales bacterium]|nr:alpha/beta hydrolase [Candidatus Saccharimonadales bacterium]